MVVYSDNLHTKAREMMAELFEYMKSRMSKLGAEVTELESLRDAMDVLEEIRKKEATIESENMAPILNVYDMLERYLPSDALTSKEQDQKSVIRSTWRKLVLKSMDVMDKLRDASGGFRTNLNKGISEFNIDLARFRNDFESHGPIVPGISPAVAMERLKRFREEFGFRERKYELNKIGEQLFAMPESKYPTLTKTRKDLNLLTQLYDLYAQVLETADDWNNITWTAFGDQKEAMSEKIEGYDLRCNKMPRKLRDWDAFKTLRQQIDDFKGVLPLLEELSKPSIEERHWNTIQNLTGTEFDPFDEHLELKVLLDADLVRYTEDVEEVTEGADKERSIRNKLADNVEIWSKRSIEFQGWKARGVPTMRGVPLLLEELEEAQMELQTLLTMRYCLPYKEEIQVQLQMLSETTETCELWLKVQMMWGNLESVFLGGDIARQLPREAKKFSKIDKDWQKIMSKADDTKIACECAANEILKAQLPPLYADLEMCQRALEGYLEQKRNAFPRFYFCSNPVLLQILSQSSDPQAMQAYYEKVFDAISSVTHNKKDKSIITEFKTRVKGFDEVIPFSTPVHAKGNVEDWLQALLGAMRATMKDMTRSCAEEVTDITLSTLKQFVWRSTGQFSLMGIQMKWTSDQQDALDLCQKSKHAMRDVQRLHNDLLLEMSSWSLDKSLNRMERMKVETMILIQVHQKDVTDELVQLYKEKAIKNVNSFDWLKQARFAWRPDGEPDVVDDDGCMIISVTDVDFQYQYEYLGIKGRLCITPLTDRCYITLAQALGMYFGGAPAGPAGTGKTETVKDMGRALGIYVVVTNCTDQMSYKSAGKIFKGLCMAGLWGCFDEFNRIKLPVLSVVAQQVLAINNAKRSAAPKFSFPGDPDQIGLNMSCGFFITMNPGYAGRQELPENLKALFRTVAMMVPDFEIIIKVTLSAVGYAEFSGISRKFARLYDLSKEQLSKQNHYDFGLRNILSVLRTGGQNKRNELEKDEYEIMYRTLRDMNLSKLVSQDVPLFLSLLTDLFPTLTSPPDSEYPEIEAAIKKVVDDRKLIHHTTWVKKVVQLYETVEVRHGLMVIGASGGGKTEMFAVLMAALSAHRSIPYRMQKYNPKAVRAQELYGEVDPLSGEWTTGVFAAIWTKANQRANKFDTWILADGPVDAIWIEDLNTVLDDNRILTLANGDRIPMTDNCKIMFENEQLDNASPATVSRCGIVYVDECELDWWPVCQAWVQSRPKCTQSLLNRLFIHYVGVWSKVEPGHIFDFMMRNCTPVMSGSRVGVITSTFRLLTGILDDVTLKEPADPNSSSPTPEMSIQLERLFIYCMVWTVGGLLEPEDRTKFSAEMYRLCDEDRGEQPWPGGSAPSSTTILPTLSAEQTLYEYYVDEYNLDWKVWRPPTWEYPESGNVPGSQLDFSNLLVPTMDSTRADYILGLMHKQKHDVLLVGGPGTAKTSVCLMFFQKFNPEKMGLKAVNFSFLTQMIDVQLTIEESLEKRGGKKFGPTGGRKLTVFFDDISMPEINEWRDQPTLEIVRQMIELDSFAFLDKDKRGEMKIVEDTQYIGAMGHPGGGRNDIPNRLKRQFLIFNITLPAIASIDDMFGQMLRGRFPKNGGWNRETLQTVKKLTEATIDLHQKVKAKMLPTPAKFHYIFNLRDLSRVFQGLLLTPLPTIKTGGSQCPTDDCTLTLVMCWKHECERVFCDKLTNSNDKAWYIEAAAAQCTQSFPEVSKKMSGPTMAFVDFWREDEYDEDGVMTEQAPKIYEPGGEMVAIKERVLFFMERHNNSVKSGHLNLVLFDDALGHLLRISRILGVPRGSCLLVGVGGSGKQSLTRLSAFIARHEVFQITLTKTYNVSSLLDDIRELYKLAGPLQKKVTFLITDSEIKDERFLLYFNSILMTGDIGGLFAKEEIMGMSADLLVKFTEDRPHLHPTPDNLRQFFIDTVRDNLHLVLCMSPANPLFPVRAQRFPGIINGVTIDWFLAWPQAALVEVSSTFLDDFKIECTEEVKNAVKIHMGTVHHMTNEVCGEYWNAMRRKVSQTPKSYLSFIQNYKTLYTEKLDYVSDQERRVALGLDKLISGGATVEKMKIALAAEKIKLGIAEQETNKMLASLQISQMEATTKGEEVAVIAKGCQADATRIAKEKAACQVDLDKAMPYVYEANDAINSIKQSDVKEIQQLKNPPPLIKVIFDTVQMLFHCPLAKISYVTFTISKVEYEIFDPTWEGAQKFMGRPDFIAMLQWFGATGKDLMNAETVELLCPYIEFPPFNPETAKKASNAAAGLCKMCRAMKFYYEASRIVKPKLEALTIAEGELAVANKALAEAQAEMKACQATLDKLQAMFEEKMAAKSAIEEGARALQRKMEKAVALIDGLSGERVRWGESVKTFGEVKLRLVGDCAVACAFTSYLGPFNQTYRALLIEQKYINDCIERNVPVSQGLDVTTFLVDVGTISDWNIQTLPTDNLSTQNGILVTQCARYPLLIDPQGQAISWLLKKEEEKMPASGAVQLNDNRLKDQLQYCMSEGKSLIVLGVEEEIDPMLDPVLEKRIQTKGRSKFINVADQMMEYSLEFRLYFITRLPNPMFSPELQAKTTVIDFTVTMKGLEDQLLGKVIGKEQSALEDQLAGVQKSVNENTKALIALDAALLNKLTATKGSLLDDEELIGILADTKQKAMEVQAKLKLADETIKQIDEKREQYRSVATRGSILYFGIVEMSQVNVMYQTSLQQFMVLFMGSMDDAAPAKLANKRSANIIDTMTYAMYRYINQGLYETDRILFVIVFTMKIMVVSEIIPAFDITIFLRGGAAIDLKSVKPNPWKWMSDEAYTNCLALVKDSSVNTFKQLVERISKNEGIWMQWYNENEPEQQPIPDYENDMATAGADAGAWMRVNLIRALRVDRLLLACRQFLRAVPYIGNRYVDPVTDTVSDVYDRMNAVTPVIYLLSIGGDPTDAIESLCRKKKNSVDSISMGEGQEPVATRAIKEAAVNGTWVLLQNCELGLPLMVVLEEMLIHEVFPDINLAFRLFITAAPNDEFPLGLLQMCTKVTNEPPSGMRAGIARSYTVMIDQDRIERVDTVEWRTLLWGLCFFHSMIQERRKFGALGWCIPYEYNNGDLDACIMFLEKHLYTGQEISWPTIQYMISQAQYGGKVTDDLDKRLLCCYANVLFTPAIFRPEFHFEPKEEDRVSAIPNDFTYKVPPHKLCTELRDYASTFPDIDNPEIYGMHPNADLTFRRKEGLALLATLADTQPKQSGGGGGGLSREDIVYEKAGQLREKAPAEFRFDVYMRAIKKQGGLDIPMNVFLYQEVQRFAGVQKLVKDDLLAVQLAIKGEVTMTQAILETINELYAAKVPNVWMFTITGLLFSFMLPNISLWCSALQARFDQWDRYVENVKVCYTSCNYLLSYFTFEKLKN